jgi:hypothetical protein
MGVESVRTVTIAEEISKQSIEGAAWLLLSTQRKRVERESEEVLN